MAKPKVDRGAGLAKLGLASALILAGAGYAYFQTVQEAKAPPAPPQILKLDSQRER